MPNCFHLLRKSTPEAGPVKLVEVDEEMCRHFGVPCDPVKWHHGWYDTVGLAVACGKTFVEIADIFYRDAAERGQLEDDEFRHMMDIVHWLADNFTADAWAEIGRR